VGTEVRLTVRLTPRGGRDGVDGVRDGVLQVRVAAPPADGAANTALARLLADELGVPRAAVRLVAGTSGRRKLVALDADGAAEAARRRWPGVAVG
jgi:uncharacterized protein